MEIEKWSHGAVFVAEISRVEEAIFEITKLIHCQMQMIN